MLGGSASSGWRISAELHSSPLPGSGSVVMDPVRAAPNVWGSEEAFLSPPDFGGILGASIESEESSEDCDDYVCGLAEEIAHSMLQEQEVEREGGSAKKSGEWHMGVPESAWSRSSYKMGSSPTSPQSTLSSLGEYQWEVRSNKCSSGMSSPPTSQEGEPMELLYEELLRVKLEDQPKLTNQYHMLSLRQQIIQRPFPGTFPHAGRVQPSAACNSQRSLQTSGSRGKCGENAHVAPKENVLALAIDRAMIVKQGRQQATRSKQGPVIAEVGGGGWCGAPAAFQPGGGGGRRAGASASGGGKKRREEQQQQHFSLFASNEGAPMRAVFLGAPASREFGGTGVFLPRRLGASHHHDLHHDSKRKPACSTVLLPSHIVQALNLNVEDTLPSPYHRRDPFSSQHRHRYATQPGNHRLEPKEEIPSSYFPMSHSTTLQEVAPNISLPTEWTY